MDLQRLADISQIVSAVAVVVSLLILAAEVRRAGREVVMASQQAQANAHAEYLLALATEPELLKLMGKYARGEPLDALETLQQAAYYHAITVQFQAAFHSAQVLGKASAGNWNHSQRALTRWTSNPRYAQWWSIERSIFDPEFAKWVDRMIPKAEPASGIGAEMASAPPEG